MVRIAKVLLLVAPVLFAACAPNENDHEKMVDLRVVKDDPDAQLINLNDAIERSKRDGSLYARRAVILLQKGSLDLALKDANEAVRLTGSEPSSLFVKAQVLRATGNRDEALQLALQAERNSYQSASLYVLLSELYLHKKEYGQALSYLKKAENLSPADEFVYYYKGRVQEALGDTTKAIKNYALSLEHSKRFLQAQRELAGLYVAMDNFSEAKPYIRSALKTGVKDAKLWYNMGLIYQSEQKSDSAFKAFKNAESINDTLPEVNYKLGVLYHGQGNNDEALVHLDKAYAAFKSKPEYLGKLASAYERAGLYSKALATYQLLVEVEPRATYAYQAIARLKYKISKPIPDSAAVRLQEQIER
ncbi:tetratricopeptide repeat protein [Pontibacter oryzae]|uniref:Uncharacterized protein n=1 Tax=Pontibacter oryzae TaxID=2304593 RepID=A0A399SJ28_9BACT|nr:tetratricopeptide repeat protein [Pontibacter oryzae]RIJ41887.1 hypothetical protein D1627_07715 [Pontibacter oryzae]